MIVVAIVLATSVFGGGKKLPPPAKLPPLPHTFADNAVGASGRLPVDWTGFGGPGAVRLANRGGTAVIAITSHLGITATSQSQLNTALDSIRHTYRAVTVKARITALVGMPALSVILYAQSSHHVPLRILVAAPQGPHHEYIVEVFNSRKAPQQDLVETQEVVSALRLAP